MNENAFGGCFRDVSFVICLLLLPSRAIAVTHVSGVLDGGAADYHWTADGRGTGGKRLFFGQQSVHQCRWAADSYGGDVCEHKHVVVHRLHDGQLQQFLRRKSGHAEQLHVRRGAQWQQADSKYRLSGQSSRATL